MPERSSVAFTFVEELDRLSGASDVMAAMQRALGPFGLEFFSFFNFPRANEILEDVRFAIRMPFELQEIIHREQYLRVSPAVRHCQRTVHPFAWNSAPYDPEREPRAAAFVDVMTAFGLESAITVPIPSPAGCNGMAWLAG
jgi:LuxR family quorum sensing-dependent transcriptional regulator